MPLTSWLRRSGCNWRMRAYTDLASCFWADVRCSQISIRSRMAFCFCGGKVLKCCRRCCSFCCRSGGRRRKSGSLCNAFCCCSGGMFLYLRSQSPEWCWCGLRCRWLETTAGPDGGAAGWPCCGKSGADAGTPAPTAPAANSTTIASWQASVMRFPAWTRLRCHVVLHLQIVEHLEIGEQVVILVERVQIADRRAGVGGDNHSAIVESALTVVQADAGDYQQSERNRQGGLAHPTEPGARRGFGFLLAQAGEQPGLEVW